MKKVINLSFMIVVVTMFFSSCGDDAIVPSPDPDGGDHEVLWSYDMGVGSLADITPAIDDNDNSYYSIANQEISQIVAFGLDKDGNELWKNEFDGTSTGKPVYAANKVFVSTDTPTAIHCINSSTGTVEWSKNLSEEYDFIWNATLAFTNNKLYVSSGQLFEGFLLAYDISGTETWIKSTNLMGGTTNLAVIGNALFFHDGSSLFRYNDNGATCDSVWEYNFSNKSSRTLMPLYDLPIGEDGNLYVRDEDIHIISQDGQLVRTVTLDASFNEMYYSNITLTSYNDILIGKGDLVKMFNDGNIEWETDISGIIVSPSFSAAATIAENGDLYDAQSFGLFCVKSNGNLNWSVTAENGGGIEYGNLHPPVLTHEGNIISVSAEQKIVRCFKGDGQGLATGGWPKPFGDYGNTSSK
jgi:outer membrane protein assembly factor BamB